MYIGQLSDASVLIPSFSLEEQKRATVFFKLPPKLISQLAGYNELLRPCVNVNLYQLPALSGFNSFVGTSEM